MRNSRFDWLLCARLSGCFEAVGSLQSLHMATAAPEAWRLLKLRGPGSACRARAGGREWMILSGGARRAGLYGPSAVSLERGRSVPATVSGPLVWAVAPHGVSSTLRTRPYWRADWLYRRGMTMVIVVPRPRAVSRSTVAPSSWHKRFTIASPMPSPEGGPIEAGSAWERSGDGTGLLGAAVPGAAAAVADLSASRNGAAASVCRPGPVS
jgi:hypothetical protein